MSTCLSGLLKESTAAAHHRAESSPFVKELLDGKLTATAIRTDHTAEFLLANHYVRLLGDSSGGLIIHRMVYADVAGMQPDVV